MPLHDFFRRNVRLRRIELGLTQVELAAKMGVTHPMISQVEAGKSCPSLELVERFAKALNCQPITLLLQSEEAIAK